MVVGSSAEPPPKEGGGEEGRGNDSQVTSSLPIHTTGALRKIVTRSDLFPPRTHPSDPLESSPRHPILRSKVVVGSSAEPPPMIPHLPRVHAAGQMPQSVYDAELLRLLCGKGVLSYWPTCTVPPDPHESHI